MIGSTRHSYTFANKDKQDRLFVFVEDYSKACIASIDFLWDNWESLTERSIRLIEKMAIIKNEYPDTYEMVWGIDFLK